MPQSLPVLTSHIIFSTKNREPFITPEIEPELHRYLGGVALDVLGVTALALGATAIAVAPAIFLARLRPAPQTAA